ncbi:NADPH-dependent FMN reductase [Saccharicrinis sp. GN24d3]
MKILLTLGGSNSLKSINKQLAVYAASLVENTQMVVADLNDFNLPVYSVDLQEEKGIPDNAFRFDNLIKEADGIVLSLAENNGLPTVAYKNLLDWVSRINKKLWRNKPMLLMATSPGERGGENVLEIMKKLMPFHGGKVVADYTLPLFFENFSDEGIKDPQKKQELEQKLKIFKNELGK